MVFSPQILRIEDLPVAKLPSRIMAPLSQLPNPSEALKYKLPMEASKATDW